MNKTTAFIPARGGSKSIPLKNIKKICGYPLIYWSIRASQRCKEIDEIIVATDSEEIKNTVLSFNFNKVKVYDRSLNNAKDQSTTEDVMLEYINKSKLNDNDNFILIQATNPFITSNDLSKGLKKLKKDNSIISVVEKNFFIWSIAGKSKNYDYMNRQRRQDIFDDQYIENGSFYINKVGNIKKFKNRLSNKVNLLIMPFYSMFEIDEPKDIRLVELLLNEYILKDESKIEYFLTDCDGVLTDGSYYYDSNGHSMKKFNTKDGMGFGILKNKGIKIGIISGDDHLSTYQRGLDLKVNYNIIGCENKLQQILDLGISLNKLVYVGDDINDYDLLYQAKYKACPRDANKKIKDIPGIKILNSKGGKGCIREYIDYLLELGLI